MAKQDEPKVEAKQDEPKVADLPEFVSVHNTSTDHRITLAVHGITKDPTRSIVSIAPGHVENLPRAVAEKFLDLYPAECKAVSEADAAKVRAALEVKHAEDLKRTVPLEQEPGETIDQFAARVQAQQAAERERAAAAAEAAKD